jgi:hypothetical protein
VTLEAGAAASIGTVPTCTPDEYQILRAAGRLSDGQDPHCSSLETLRHGILLVMVCGKTNEPRGRAFRIRIRRSRRERRKAEKHIRHPGPTMRSV